LVGSGTPPQRLELAAHGGVVDALVAGQGVLEAQHVAGALHVVLPAQGNEARTRPAHVTGEQGQVDQAEGAVDTRHMLGDAHAPQDHAARGLAVDAGSAADALGGHAGDRGDELRRVLLQAVAQRVEVLGARLDEGRVGQAFLDDHMRQAVEQRDIGSGVRAQPDIGVVDHLDAARVDDDDARAVFVLGLEYRARCHRVSLGGVGADDQEGIGLADVAHRRAGCTAAHRLAQGRHRSLVAQAGAVVDVVGADGAADELLEDVVVLVGGARRRQPGDGLRAVLLLDLQQPLATKAMASSQLASSSGAPLPPRRIKGLVSRSGWLMKPMPKRPLTQRLPSLASEAKELLTPTTRPFSVSSVSTQPTPQ
jgi:hypothetical protein